MDDVDCEDGVEERDEERDEGWLEGKRGGNGRRAKTSESPRRVEKGGGLGEGDDGRDVNVEGEEGAAPCIRSCRQRLVAGTYFSHQTQRNRALAAPASSAR